MLPILQNSLQFNLTPSFSYVSIFLHLSSSWVKFTCNHRENPEELRDSTFTYPKKFSINYISLKPFLVHKLSTLDDQRIIFIGSRRDCFLCGHKTRIRRDFNVIVVHYHINDPQTRDVRGIIMNSYSFGSKSLHSKYVSRGRLFIISFRNLCSED